MARELETKGGWTVTKIARVLAVMFIVSLFGTNAAMAQGYPTPRAAGSPADSCTVCPAPLPTYPYSAPIKAFKGRFMDSHRTKDYQQPERTYRARKFQHEPSTQRVYAMYGSTVAAWSETSFFTKLGGPLSGPPATRLNSDGTVAEASERYVAPDSTFYAEKSWIIQVVDGQIRLFDLATDDRGYVYPAYSAFGWGVLRDTGSLVSVKQITNADPIAPPSSPSSIVVAKSGSRYLAVVGWRSGYTVYDVTVPASPTKLYDTANVRNSVGEVAQTTNFSHIAITNSTTGDLRIISGAQLASGSAGITVSPTSGDFEAVGADDEYFWATEGLGPQATSYRIWKIHAATGATQTFTLPVTGGITPLKIEATDGALAVTGKGTGADGVSRTSQVLFYDTKSGAPVEIPVGDWFESFYFAPPAGYAKPEQTYIPVDFSQAVPHINQGKTYLIWSGYGFGDAFEIQAGDSLDIRPATPVSWGTQNPKNPNRTQGPYYGDTVTFTSSYSGQITPNVNWNFGNTGSLGNTTTTPVGTNVPYRYKDLTSAGTIGAVKIVTGTSATDSSINDSENVTLLVPTARILHDPAAAQITAGGAYAGPVVVGDNFYDASDGTVESHFGVWTLNGVTTQSAPTVPVRVDACGANTLSFIARYQQYSGSTAAIPIGANPFDVAISSVSFTAVPFSAKPTISGSNASTLTFSNAGRTSSTAFNTGATWTVQWNLLDSSDAPLGTQPISSVWPVGTVPSFPVSKPIVTGSKVRLTITVDAGAMAAAGCGSFLTATADFPLAPPDPFVSTASCTQPTTLGNCTLSANSLSGRDQTGWTYAWSVTPSIGSLPATRTISPASFPAAGSYSVSVTATNAIDSTTSSPVNLNVAQPPCVPTPANTIYYSYSAGSGTSATFDAKILGTSYSWQDCDTLTWAWGDGTSPTVGNKTNALSVTHTFASNGSFNVSLTVSNSAGASRVYTQAVQVGTVTPPPPPPPPPPPTGCTAPKAGALFVGFSGPQSGCKPGAASPPCNAGETVSFKVETFGYTIQSCDTFTWKFGDGVSGSGQTPSHAYTAAGTYTVELRVSNSAGSTTTTGPVVVSAGVCEAPSNDIKISWVGQGSGCTPINGTTCTPGEPIKFVLSSATNYKLQTCDSVSWDFGDGQTSNSKVTSINHTYTTNGPFLVGIAVSNSSGTVTDAKTLSFVPTAKPVVSIEASSTTGSPGDTLSFTGSVQSAATVTGHLWRVLRVAGGSNQVVRTVSNQGGITHTFDVEGDYKVEYTASNGGGTSDPAIVDVTISNRNQFAFLLPVVAHLNGQNDTKWRTDLQIYNTDPLNAPISLEFEFRGGSTQFTKTLMLSASTKVYEDLLSELVAPFSLDDAGPVIVRGAGASPPQMWTRTYTVDASGIGSYGQLIPAVRLDSAPQSGEAPGSYVVPGLEISSRYRTNLGLVNPSTQSIQATVTVTDDSMLGFPIGQFTIDIAPYALKQLSDLSTRVPEIKNGKPFSVRIATAGNASLVVYGSMIDQVSNDPVYIPGVHESAQAGIEKQLQIVPGAGHFAQGADTWRSDVVVYNADTVPVKFNLSYYDSDGQKVAEAREQALGPGAFTRVEDVLRWPLLDKTPPDSFGMIKVETVGTGIVRYPIVLERTYKDRGAHGTFGQGIPAISPERPNVEVNKPAFIAGVRSDTSFYTNLGLIAVGNTAARVRVSLLDGNSGQVVGTWERIIDGQTAPIAPNASLIATNIIRALSPTATQGTLKIEVLEGGAVWAYASVIAAADPSCGCTLPNHTFDPEYLPAVQSPN